MPTLATDRPLTEEERRLVEIRHDDLRTRRHVAPQRTAAAVGIVCGALALVTILLSNAPLPVILAFWGVMSVGLAVWTGRAVARSYPQVDVLERALRVSRGRALRIRARRVVELEEVEDEGACFAFQVLPDQVLLLHGQQYYADETFPNSDFTILDVLDEDGGVADTLLISHGVRLRPERAIARSIKASLEIPGDLTMMRGDLRDIETLLGPAR